MTRRLGRCAVFFVVLAAGCVDDDTPGADAAPGGDAAPQLQTYHYVLLQDLNQDPVGIRPGTSIDAIELRKAGVSTYLAQVHDLAFGAEVPPGDNAMPANVLGAPQIDCTTQAPEEWDLSAIVSLGGQGGYLLASFTGLAEIEAGDQLVVHGCSTPVDEGWDLLVGVATTPSDPNFFLVQDTGLGRTTITVPVLPSVPRP